VLSWVATCANSKWQKLKMLFWSARWARLRQELFQNATTALAGIGGILAITSGMAATLQPLFGGGGDGSK
jgi:hypothetical protein